MSTLSGLGIITERTLNFCDTGDSNEDEDDQLNMIEEVKVENLPTIQEEQGCSKSVNMFVT